ncbi:MAG: hypothetical protein RLZZ553_775 [Verrucomicrobiota bacterium]|jgi:AcrR family transcriptional regulator
MEQRKKNPIATRARILKSAGEEYCRMGFQAARLNAIVENAGITKGSLFHHFSGKDDLALQWLLETLPPILQRHWVIPLEQTTNPIDALKQIFRESSETFTRAHTANTGMHSMAKLMASIDESNKELHEASIEIQQTWHRVVSEALLRGQREKLVHAAIVVSDEAHFIISIAVGASIQSGVMGPGALTGWLRSADAYLETLRPA